MKRPRFIDYKPEKLNCEEDYSKWCKSYAEGMDKYVDYLESNRVELIQYTYFEATGKKLSIEDAGSILKDYEKESKL